MFFADIGAIFSTDRNGERVYGAVTERQCSAAILRGASGDSLQKLLGIKAVTAHKVVDAGSEGARSLDDFKSKLPAGDAKQVTNGIAKLS